MTNYPTPDIRLLCVARVARCVKPDHTEGTSAKEADCFIQQINVLTTLVQVKGV